MFDAIEKGLRQLGRQSNLYMRITIAGLVESQVAAIPLLQASLVLPASLFIIKPTIACT